jgi:GntR family transcriptional regulator, rspAB operon transcriptional repressor
LARRNQECSLRSQTMSTDAARARKPSKDHGLAAEAYATVRERIIRGELAVGQVISRRKLAAELGMSFLPITEALIRLENEGLVESKPRAGTRVKIPTRQDVEGHYVIREALEVQAAMLFAEMAERHERSALLRLAKRLDALSAQPNGDRLVFAALHQKLHRLIAQFARCSALSDEINKLYAAAATWLCAARPLSQRNSKTEHQDLIKVLVNGSPAAAGEAMRRHVRHTKECALFRLEVLFRLQKQYPHEYPRSGKKALSLTLLLSDPEQPVP